MGLPLKLYTFLVRAKKYDEILNKKEKLEAFVVLLEPLNDNYLVEQKEKRKTETLNR